MSSTAVCNQALRDIGQSVITDIDDTTNDTARTCKLVFEETVREVQRSHPWNCLKKRQQLALNPTPAFGWDYSYTIPTNCLRVVTVNGHDTTSNYKEDLYEIEGRDVLTDADECMLTYIEYSEDTVLWDSLLRRCIISLLASRLAMALAQDPELAALHLQKYEDIDMPRAQRIDSNERKRRPYNPIGDSTWVKARWIQPG